MNNNVKQDFIITVAGEDLGNTKFSLNSYVKLPKRLFPSTIVQMILVLLMQTEHCLTGLLQKTDEDALTLLAADIREHKFVYLDLLFQEKKENLK